eukprot:5577144-Amphidinium_carterae.1
MSKAQILVGSNSETEDLPHKAGCTVVESQTCAETTAIVQALWPAKDMPEEKWLRIQKGDIQCFRKLLEDTPHFCLCSQIIDVFTLGKISDHAATALVRIKHSALDAFLKASGDDSDLFFNPLGEQRNAYKVLWLRKAGNRQDAVSFMKSSEVASGALGLVWKKDGLGIRFSPDLCAEEKKSLGGPAAIVWTVAGLRFDAIEDVVSDLLSGMNWTCTIHNDTVRAEIITYYIRAAVKHAVLKSSKSADIQLRKDAATFNVDACIRFTCTRCYGSLLLPARFALQTRPFMSAERVLLHKSRLGRNTRHTVACST